MPEDQRHQLAFFLKLPEDVLRSPTARTLAPAPVRLSSAYHSGLAAPVAQVTTGAASSPGDVPIFTERDQFDPTKATEWIGRPPLLGHAGPLLAVWIAADHGSRLRAGDLAFVRINQPPRAGDSVVVLSGDELVCMGELLEFKEKTIRISTSQHDEREVAAEDHRVLKVACIALP